ncbi:MAG: type II secretion system protein [Bdellovibrionaceae bacterium]|nr:type II secretion system protein [Pseudobdellovibrionaceae bacterium]
MISRGRAKHSGFTLLEVLIAMIILSAGVMLLAQSWSSSYNRIKKTQRNVEIAALLERKLAEIDMKYRGKAIDSIAESEGDEFEGHPEYSWKLESKKFEMPDLTSVLIGREGGVDQMMMNLMKQFSEHLSNSIKEVKVTVIFKHNDKEFEYSATLLFVDYDKQLPLPSLPGAGG